MSPSMYKKQGIWVFRTSGQLKASVVDLTIEKVRKEREQQVLGRMKSRNKKAQAKSDKDNEHE
jgi:hypothetical protein